MKLIKPCLAAVFTLISLQPLSAAEALALGAPFADNAILQREMAVPVWGWSEPGTKVSVEFAGQNKEATAGDNGKWMLELEPLKANAEPATMKISETGGEAVILKNILVGEVWLASGQSNMQWIADKSDVGQVLQKEIAARVEAGEEQAPVIREAKITDYFAALHPIEHATAEWSEAGGDSSAIAYAFAYKLHRELGVPIGILNCSFSQTSIQAWTPRSGFEGAEDAYTQAIYQKILETDPTTPEHKAAWEKFYKDIEDTVAENKDLVAQGKKANEINTRTPGNLSGNRDASWLFNARLSPMIPYAIKGAIWNQGYANMNEGLVYYNNLHSMIRGWRKLWDRPELPVYFHQFYSPRQKGEWDFSPTIGGTAEMRLGTWLARDIPHTGMASQIDISGAIHYVNKTLPGQRLALHALKNQYGKDVTTDGPMFESYEVKGDKLIVTFENADGLQVAETGTNSKSGLAIPTVIPNGADQVKFFYLTGEDRVWYPASIEIDGNKVIVSSPQVKSPRGVSYATGGTGNQPNLYNKALLPATPFIYYDNELVTSETWPHDPMKIDGVEIDPSAGGLLYEFRRFPILSTQFRDNAVLQAGVPVTIWGATGKQYVPYEGDGEKVIKFSFAGIEKTIPVDDEMDEWSVTLPVMQASSEPNTLKVTLEIGGEIAHQRICENIVFGDVWYVAAPVVEFELGDFEKTDGLVRMITRKAKRSSSASPSPYSIAVSTTPENRFASVWEDAEGPAAAIGHRIAKITGKPVGIVFMQTNKGKTGPDAELKHWISPTCLNQAPSLMEDYKDLAAIRPGNEFFDANASRYIAAWKAYWGEYIPTMMETKAVPDGQKWGSFPVLAGKVTSTAGETYNVLTHSFIPASFKGAVFLSGPDMFVGEATGNFGEQLSALANCWKQHFGGEDLNFIYTVPSEPLVANVSKPAAIKGESHAVEISSWENLGPVAEAIGRLANENTE